ncbi:MAG: hypothetical protein Q8S01_03555, partial [Ignavibacteria bacterium]|nr:hypothetical protein [Ignavibacteria bacterium]
MSSNLIYLIACQLDKLQTQVIEDLTHCRNKVTSAQFQRVLETLLALSVLERNSEIYSQITPEPERHQAITNDTELIAEIALTHGEVSQGILSSIKGRIEEVQTIYRTDKLRNNTLPFFKDAFLGMPCFNGRLINIREYSIMQHPELACEEIFFDRKAFDNQTCRL